MRQAMLRTSIAPSRQLLSSSVRGRAAGQWLHSSRARRGIVDKRCYSRLQTANALPRGFVTSAEQTATYSTSTTPPGPNDPNVRSPASPSHESAIHPESVPKPPTHPTHEQTSPGSSVNPPEHKSTPPSPPPPPPPRKNRFRRFLIYLILATGITYGGGVWLSLKSDNFHDFFTEYVPYGEEAVLYLEERDFRRRFPNATRQVNRHPVEPRLEGQSVTIPGKSGLSWKVAEQEKEAEKTGSDVSKRGKHMSAVEANKREEGVTKVEDAKAESKKAQKEPEPAARQTSAETSQPTKAPALEEPRSPAVPAATSVSPLDVGVEDEPAAQELMKIVNDLITVINADESASRLLAPLTKAKDDFQKLATRVAGLRNEAHGAAQEEIEASRADMEKTLNTLLRRVDEVRSEDAAQFREEYEAEREKLSRAYQEKIQTELARVQEVAEQRLRNELVEQAIELNRKFLGDVESLVEKERDGRLSKLSDITENVAELERLTAEWNGVVDTNLKTQQLQIAIDAVRSALENSDIPRPFINELVAMKELASSDPVVNAAIASISPSAYQRGIPSSAQVVERFRRLANEVRKASLLPENAGIASHATSLVMSKVMFKKEASLDGDDVESVLARTENFLEEGRFDEAAREMNSLQGWSRLLSKDWLADVRRVLEVKQALEVIETEARLQCLQVE